MKYVIHHTASPKKWTTVRDVNRWHKNAGYQVSKLGYYVAYHYLIEEDGQITQTRNLVERTKHTRNKDINNKSIAICLIGNFEEEKPSKEQLQALKRILQGKDFSWHKMHSPSLCPGKNLIKHLNDWKNREDRLSKLKRLLKLIKKLKLKLNV